MEATDLFRLSAVNLDRFTENYNRRFYTHYFTTWPEYNVLASSWTGRPAGYVLGKCEGAGTDWHGHVTALTVGPAHRRLGIAGRLMAGLEAVSAHGDMFFVDLYVRESNAAARAMYARMGYGVYRRVQAYYGEPPEDALDMRKPLPRDANRRSLVATRPVIHARDLFH